MDETLLYKHIKANYKNIVISFSKVKLEHTFKKTTMSIILKANVANSSVWI
jgi:predicted PilT family ATPase